jgi:hypothetical protein
MMVPFRTFALFALALGMLGAGYLFAPAPGAATSPAQPVAVAAAPEPVVAPAAKQPAPAVVAGRPPVPLVTPPRATYVSQATLEKPASGSSSEKPGEKPTVNMGVFKSNPPDPDAPIQALTAPPSPSGNDSQAKRAIELDGYKNVSGLTKGPDGMWRGRALRGRTEIAVRVDASGNVSAE